jgi:putative membrane protein
MPCKLSQAAISVPAWAKHLIDDDGLRRIHDAVTKVEKHTSAEIVPMLVSHSSTTGHVPWVLFLFLMMLTGVLVPQLAVFTALEIPYWLFEIVALVLAIVGTWTFASMPYVRHWLTPRLDQVLSVERRALLEFHLAQVQDTEHRTGILLMVSSLERRAIVIADKSIDERLPKATWDNVIAILLEKTKAGNFADGIVAALEALIIHLEPVFPPAHDNKDELENGLIIKV